MRDDRLKRLARQLDRLVEEDERLMEQTRKVEAVRRGAAVQLHGVCSSFVAALNALLEKLQIEMSPEEFCQESFRDSGMNLFQINARGRLIQIAFESTDTLVSTEVIRTPYVLHGSVRWYNQELLEGKGIEEEQIFFCIDDKTSPGWRFLDSQTRRIRPFDTEHLTQLMERL